MSVFVVCKITDVTGATVDGVKKFAGRTFSICTQCGAFEHDRDRAEHHAAASSEMVRLHGGNDR